MPAVLVALILPGAATAGPSSPDPLVRLTDGPGGDRLTIVDPLTLAPRSRPIRTFRDGFAIAFSPDGGRLAQGSGFRGRARLHLIDVERWRSLGRLDLPGRGPVQAVWPVADRVVALAGAYDKRRHLLTVDPHARAVVARHGFRGRILSSVATADGLAVLVAPARGIGAARLLVAGVDGGLRSVRLGRIRAGGNEHEPRVRSGSYRQPGLAVDPEGGHAFVVAAKALVIAHVDLLSGTVSHHPLRGVRPGARAAKGNFEVWWREAVWLGDGALAVTGYHSPPTPRGARFPATNDPFGVRLVDTRAWTIRILDPRPSIMHAAAGRLLAYGTNWTRGYLRSRSTGLLAYNGSGKRQFERFRGRDVTVSGIHGRLAYVWVRPARRLHVVDLKDGRTLRRIAVRPRELPFLFSAPR